MPHCTRLPRLDVLCLLALTVALSPPAAADDDRAALFSAGEQAKNLVVRLSGADLDGSGILFHFDGSTSVYGVTAAHVFRHRGGFHDELQVQFYAWSGKKLVAQREKVHHQEDLATFKVDLTPLGIPPENVARLLPFDQLGAPGELDPGYDLYTVGHAQADAWISPKSPAKFQQSIASVAPGVKVLQIEHFCPPGHSGGAVFDNRWRLVGMIFSNEEPFCNALAIDSVIDLLHRWKYDIDLRVGKSESNGAPRKARQITIAVMDFDNRSGTELPRIGLMAQDITNSYLFNLPGVTVVTRDRLASVNKELTLEGTENAPAKVKQVGSLLDADAIVTGSIIRYDVERRQFSGFETSALSDEYRMTISLQMLDVVTGTVRFAKTFDVTRKNTYVRASSAPAQPLQRESELLKDLLEQARPDLQNAITQVVAGLDTAGKLLAVEIRSTPEGADILLNGVFMGTTPKTLDLSSGLHEIEISKTGHEIWRRRVLVESTTRLDIDLVPRSY